MENTLNNESEKKNIPTENGGITPQTDKVPFQKVDIRTMSSDISSISQTGGGTPLAHDSSVTNPSELKNAAPSGGIAQNKDKSSHLFLWLIVILTVLIVGTAVYFLIPSFYSMKNTATNNIPQEQPAVVIPSKPEIPEVIEVHVSFLKGPADITSEIKPEIFSVEGLKSVIQNTSTTVPIFKELIIKKENKPITLGTFTSLFFPNSFTPEQLLNFENDFTTISYTNAAGTWLGFVARLKDSADIEFMKKEIKNIENESAIENFYLSSPGNKLSWKTGALGKYQASILEFSTRNIEFTYVLIDRNLIVASNLEAAKEIIKRLGF